MAKPALHYEVHAGLGRPLLLVHGMLSSRAHWLPNIAALSRVSTPVVVELFGHGRAPAPEEPDMYTPEHYVEEFEAIREELSAGRWSICGQSLGAALTLRYALDHPHRIIAQVFTNSMSALADESWSRAILPVMKEQARRLEAEGWKVLESHPFNPSRSDRLPPDARAALINDYRLHDPRGIGLTGAITVARSSVRARIAENRVPALLVVGTREKRFAGQRRFAEQAMPHLEVVQADAGHAVNLEAADTFNAAVTSFLERHARDSAPL